MRYNLSDLDRLLRFLLGSLLCVATFCDLIGYWGYLAGTLGIVTALFGWCPLYRTIGLRTGNGRAAA